MTRTGWVFVVVLIAVGGAAVVAGYTYRGHHAETPRQAAIAPTATIKDLMDAIVDPSADLVWDSVATTVAENGINDRVPRSDADWAVVRHGAIGLVEGANLLMMPGRHVAPSGVKSETPGVELEPEEMDALIAKDRATWERHAQDLHAVSLEVLHAVDTKDADALFEVGGRIDTACENCHKQYWYPNEKIPEFPKDFANAQQIGVPAK
jgi:hypothetical protein